MMTDESQSRGDHSPTPDSISETVGTQVPSESVPATNGLGVSSEMGFMNDLSQPSTSAMAGYAKSDKQQHSSTEIIDRSRPRLSLNSDVQLPGSSSSSAFRVFVSEPIVVSPENTKSPTQSQRHLISITPTSRRQTIPGSTVPVPGSQTSGSPNPDNSGIGGESSNANNDNDDGRTTASAPPCTPAPEPHLQAQSPFRNSKPIKRIDLLAMSRSRQSDRAENARRDGRLAPSPRKKDEVLRNSGYLFPANRSYGFQPNTRLTNEGFISPERVLNGASSATSPNVDVVSIDDQTDASKYKFSIQFHNIEQAEQMMKCNLCGFVTNNQRFYRRHRRLHNRQHPPNQIHCSQCDYTTTQIRRMREHTMTHQNLPSQSTSTNPHFRSSNLAESTQNPHFQGHFFLPSGTIYPPTTRPINLPLSAVPTTVMSNTASLGGLHTFVPTAPQEPQPQVQVNEQIGLQHPPRGSALMGNCSPNTGQVANYMRSFLSNLMSPTRSHPPSTVTSSSLYRSVPEESQNLIQSSNNPPIIDDTYNMSRFWNHNSNNPSLLSGRNVPGNSFVKIKAEPRPAPISQMTHVIHDLPSSTQDRHNLSPHRPSDNVDSESGMDVSSDERPTSPVPHFVDSRLHTRVSTETNQMVNSGGEAADVSTQRSMPCIKIEFPSNSESCNWRHRPPASHSDRGVQCDIISISSGHRHSGRTQSETVSSAGGVLDSKCYFCGVTFDDEVLYSIHIGCHSHTDPFLCNVCGKQCHNKYGFYSHIMRGHQSRPNNT